MNDLLTTKTKEELMEIRRNSIDNAYVPSSIYHKVGLELEFRDAQEKENEKKEILKLSPEFYGMEINLKSLWKKVKSLF